MSRVLVVAPDSNLEHQQNEVDGLLNTLPNAIAITGDITEKRLVGYFEDKLEGIWFTGHGALEGVLLNNETLNADALVSYINRVEASWVVMNVCNSDQLINKLLLATSADVLVVSNEILDLEAWRVARLVAMEMAAGKDIREAVQNILPGQLGRHRFYENSKRFEQMYQDHRNGGIERGELNRKLDELLASVGQVRERIAILETKVDNLEEKLEAQKNGFWAAILGTVVFTSVLSALIHSYGW